MKNDKDLKTIQQQFKEQLNAPKTYEQFVLEQSLTEQQDLYPDLVHEDISSSRGYGPCSASSCSHDEKVRCYIKVGFKQDRLFNWHFKNTSKDPEEKFEWIIIENIDQAYSAESNLEDDTYEVVGATGDSDTEKAQDKKAEVVDFIHDCIKEHEKGKDVYHARKSFN